MQAFSATFNTLETAHSAKDPGFERPSITVLVLYLAGNYSSLSVTLHVDWSQLLVPQG
jgi:hypothetical protein